RTLACGVLGEGLGVGAVFGRCYFFRLADKLLRSRCHGIRWSFDLRYNPIGKKTGRPWFPGFVARSEQYPERELHDAEQWGQMWRDARRNIVPNGIPTFNRWDGNAIGCA
ncbi:MAG: hypothetical protein ACPGWR_32680, partial [Ardenticatenaceae bacterium]